MTRQQVTPTKRTILSSSRKIRTRSPNVTNLKSSLFARWWIFQRSPFRGNQRLIAGLDTLIAFPNYLTSGQRRGSGKWIFVLRIRRGYEKGYDRVTCSRRKLDERNWHRCEHWKIRRGPWRSFNHPIVRMISFVNRGKFADRLERSLANNRRNRRRDRKVARAYRANLQSQINWPTWPGRGRESWLIEDVASHRFHTSPPRYMHRARESYFPYALERSMARRALFSSQPRNVSKRLNAPTLASRKRIYHYCSMTRVIFSIFPASSRFRNRARWRCLGRTKDKLLDAVFKPFPRRLYSSWSRRPRVTDRQNRLSIVIGTVERCEKRDRVCNVHRIIHLLPIRFEGEEKQSHNDPSPLIVTNPTFLSSFRAFFNEAPQFDSTPRPLLDPPRRVIKRVKNWFPLCSGIWSWLSVEAAWEAGEASRVDYARRFSRKSGSRLKRPLDRRPSSPSLASVFSSSAKDPGRKRNEGQE